MSRPSEDFVSYCRCDEPECLVLKCGQDQTGAEEQLEGEQEL